MKCGTDVHDQSVDVADKPVEEDANALVTPDSQKLVDLVEAVRSGHRQAVVDARQVSQVEDVVELGRRRRQIAHHRPGIQPPYIQNAKLYEF